MQRCSKCGKILDGKFTATSMCYPCFEKHKEEKFHKYGKSKCKMCGALISADRTHCYACYKKYVLKKID
ncbi:MAG: hypothetical protein HGB08_02625 [Candidatus Moranbacteria bacterium]|nr:hypothetical protein [Candidatus Moranbacteria bacterium]